MNPAFFESGYGGNTYGGLSDAMSFSSTSKYVDQLSQFFGGFSITPEDSESSHPVEPHGGSYTYPEYPMIVHVPVPIPAIPVSPPILRDFYQPHEPQPRIRYRPGFPKYSIYVALDQYNYDRHVETYMTTYAHMMTWYAYCLMQDQQPHTFQGPRHSTYE